jgi:NTP pyrophosphatase (non-canonical NTP hydrolase)
MDELRYREAIERTMKPMNTMKKLAMLGMGIGGEAGEVTDILKKVVFHGHELDREKMVEELGDLEWYITHLKKELGISDDEVRMKNIMKLNKRYKKGFSEEESINREL